MGWSCGERKIEAWDRWATAQFKPCSVSIITKKILIEQLRPRCQPILCSSLVYWLYAHNVVGPRCQQTTRRKHFLFLYTNNGVYNKKWGTCLRTTMDMVGPYCHPLHVQSSPYSSWLLTMLTMPDSSASRTPREPRRRTMVRPQTERTGAMEDVLV